MASLRREPAGLESDWSDEQMRPATVREALRPTPAHTPAAGVRAWAAEAPTALWLGVIVTASAVLWFVFGLAISAPWIIPDELIYAELAKSFASTGHFAVRDLPFSAWSYGPLYPILISPAFRLATSVPHAYLLVKAINAVSMSIAAIPGYLLARRLVSRRAALLAAVFTVLVPSIVYTTKVMTENASYPIFLFTVLAMIGALERPSARRQLAVLALMLVAVLTRAQMIVLLPAFLTAAAAVGVVDERRFWPAVRRAFTSFLLTWAVSLVGAVLLLAVKLSGASSRSALLGGHGKAVHGASPLALAKWFLYHLAEIDLYTGVIPFAAFSLLLVRVLSRREPSREIRIFVITSAAIFLWLLVLVAVYMSGRPVGRVFDRYVFYAVPLMLISLLVWVRLDLPRPRRTTRAVVLVAWLLPAVLPFNSLLDGHEWGTSSSAVGLVPWYLIHQLAGLSGVEILFVGIVLLLTGRLALLVLRSTSTTSMVLIRMTVIYLATVGLVAQAANVVVATRASDVGLGSATPAWIDRAVGADAKVAAVWTGTKRRGVNGWYTIWENEFFNRSVGAVYYLGQPLRYTVLLPAEKVDLSAGRLVRRGGVAVQAQYVLTDVTLPIVGRRIAHDAKTGMDLYRVDGPIRVRRRSGAPLRAIVEP